jgi:DNA-damage-inducible protein J
MVATAKKPARTNQRGRRSETPTAKKTTGQVKKPASAKSLAGKPVVPPHKVTEMIHVRVNYELKDAATKTLEAIGMTLPEAMRLFLYRVVVEKALPLRLDVPNAETRAAMESSRTIRPGRFSTPEEMFDALEKAAER